MLLSVKSDIAVESKLKSIGTTLKYKLEDEDIIFDSLKIADGVVSFELLDKDDLPKLEEILKEDFKDISIKRDGLNFSISLNQKLIEQTKENAIKQAVDTIRNRLNMYGLAEPTVAKQGKDKILVEIPGVKTSEDEQRIRELIAKAAHLQMMAVDEDRASRVDSMSEAEAKSYGDIILPDVADPKERYLLHSIPILDGSMLVDARVGYDSQTNRPVIHFTVDWERCIYIWVTSQGKSVGQENGR